MQNGNESQWKIVGWWWRWWRWWHTHTHICTVHAFTTPKTKTLLHGCMDAYTHNKEAIVSSIVSMEILAKIAYPTNSPDSNQKLRPPQPNWIDHRHLLFRLRCITYYYMHICNTSNTRYILRLRILHTITPLYPSKIHALKYENTDSRSSSYSLRILLRITTCDRYTFQSMFVI